MKYLKNIAYNHQNPTTIRNGHKMDVFIFLKKTFARWSK